MDPPDNWDNWDNRDPPDNWDNRDPPVNWDNRDPPFNWDNRDPPDNWENRDPPVNWDNQDPPDNWDNRDPLYYRDDREEQDAMDLSMKTVLFAKPPDVDRKEPDPIDLSTKKVRFAELPDVGRKRKHDNQEDYDCKDKRLMAEDLIVASIQNVKIEPDDDVPLSESKTFRHLYNPDITKRLKEKKRRIEKDKKMKPYYTVTMKPTDDSHLPRLIISKTLIDLPQPSALPKAILAPMEQKSMAILPYVPLISCRTTNGSVKTETKEIPAIAKDIEKKPFPPASYPKRMLEPSEVGANGGDNGMDMD